MSLFQQIAKVAKSRSAKRLWSLEDLVNQKTFSYFQKVYLYLKYINIKIIVVISYLLKEIDEESTFNIHLSDEFTKY